jgi:excisionase family DNA binding protein
MTPQSTYEVLIPIEETARRLGVSVATLERWTARRIVPCYRLGQRCLRFDYGEVRAALTKFGRPALRRLERGPYKPRRNSTRTKFYAVQTELCFQRDDPAQILLPLDAPGSEIPAKGDSGN